MERAYLINYDKTKEENVLGIKFFTQEESTRDGLADFEGEDGRNLVADKIWVEFLKDTLVQRRMLCLGLSAGPLT
jgi:hypothetical protein